MGTRYSYPFCEMDSLDELKELRITSRAIRDDFNSRAKSFRASARPVNLNIAGVMDMVIGLAKSVDTLCLRDFDAYLRHVEQQANGGNDETLAILEKLCSDAYKEIQLREQRLNETLSSTNRAEEALNDLVGRAEAVEKRVGPIKEALLVEKDERQARLGQAQEREREAIKDAREAQESYDQARAALEDKRTTNKNIFTGLGDWFTRKDDKFDMLYSLGINSDEIDRNDDRRIKGLRALKDDAEADAVAAKTEWREIVTAGRKARQAVKKIEKMLEQMNVLKDSAVKTIANLESRENALAKVATAITELENSLEICKGQRTLPTIEEMARKLLLVIVGAGHYAEFENAVQFRTRQLFAIVDGLVKWLEIFDADDDDDLKDRYELAKRLAIP